MKNIWPRVGIIGSGHLSQLIATPATALGVEIVHFEFSNKNSDILEIAKTCDVVSFENMETPLTLIKELEKNGISVRPNSKTLELVRSELRDKKTETNLAVLVARSPHGQISTWAPTKVNLTNINNLETITPAPDLSEELNLKIQDLAIKKANEVNLIGVMCISMTENSGVLTINEIVLGLSDLFNWTIEGSTTNQFEQFLRAILDLPLGDTALIERYIVCRSIVSGEKIDMYRPYLHLMARSPKMKFHQYKNCPNLGSVVGHLTISGDSLGELQNEALHAVEYFNGVVDE